jgi:hypothetical protein
MTARAKARLPDATLFVFITAICFLLMPGCGLIQTPGIQSVTLPPIPNVRVATEAQASSTPLPTLTASRAPTPTVVIPTATLTITPSTTPQPDNWFSVADESVKVWDDSSHEDDYWSLQTELITGEHVFVLDQQDEWSRIVAVEQPSSKDPRGYPGWVRSSSLVKGWRQGEKYMIVMVRSTILRKNQEPTSDIVMKLQFDTRLPVIAEENNQVLVRLPDGRQGWLDVRDVRLAQNREDRYPLDGFYETANSLVDIPYVWGGTTSNALDCSGFFYRLFHAYGIVLARDANDQILGGAEVDAKEIVRGNLVFTADRLNGSVTHVVMIWGNGLIIDSEPGRGISIHPLTEWMKTDFLSGARTYLP